MKKITAKRAIALLRKVVKEFGTKRTNTRGSYLVCQYLINGEPDCIIAHCLIKAGVPIDVLSSADASAHSSVSTYTEFHDYCEPDAIGIFDAAQRSADAENNWGDALTVAIKAYKDLIDREN